MTQNSSDDPRRAMWSGAGGAISDPTIRSIRGTVRSARGRFGRLLIRLRAHLTGA